MSREYNGHQCLRMQLVVYIYLITKRWFDVLVVFSVILYTTQWFNAVPTYGTTHENHHEQLSSFHIRVAVAQRDALFGRHIIQLEEWSGNYKKPCAKSLLDVILFFGVSKMNVLDNEWAALFSFGCCNLDCGSKLMHLRRYIFCNYFSFSRWGNMCLWRNVPIRYFSKSTLPFI